MSGTITDNIKILGNGWFSPVIIPPLLCDVEVPPNSVGKIGNYKLLKREYDFIIQYIKYSPTYAELVNNENVILCKINYDSVSNELKQKIIDLVSNEPITPYNREDNSQDNVGEYQLIMPYLGKTFDKYINIYKNNCETNTSNFEVISVDIFIKYINSINILFHEILVLNDNGLYHNDIKPDNLIYNETTNYLLLIDFNNSISKHIPEYFSHEITIFQKYTDLYTLIEKVVLELLLVGLSNKYIYDNFIQIYRDIKRYFFVVISPIKRQVVEITPKTIDDIKNKLIEFMSNIMSIVHGMNTSQPTEINTDKTFCNDKIIIPINTQRAYAYKLSKDKESRQNELSRMLIEDKKGGKKKRNKIQTKKRNRNTKRRKHKTKRRKRI